MSKSTRTVLEYEGERLELQYPCEECRDSGQCRHCEGKGRDFGYTCLACGGSGKCWLCDEGAMEAQNG